LHHTQAIVLNENVSQRSCSTAYSENKFFHYLMNIKPLTTFLFTWHMAIMFRCRYSQVERKIRCHTTQAAEASLCRCSKG